MVMNDAPAGARWAWIRALPADWDGLDDPAREAWTEGCRKAAEEAAAALGVAVEAVEVLAPPKGTFGDRVVRFSGSVPG